MSEYYTKTFYEQLRSGAKRSAEIVVPLVLQFLTVRSVVDVGCGDGSWLAVFREHGVKETLGVDGEYVDKSFLQIPQDCFQALDLAKPFGLGRVFDLAVSLEVAEHLPADFAPVFVECLTRLAPVVLFSAAIPFQGGTNHINEQWPEAWAALFREYGYLPVDLVRKRVWHNDAVDWWYAQNILLFARADLIESNPTLKAEFEQTNPSRLALVHPKQYLYLGGRYLEADSRAQKPMLPLGVKAASKYLLICLRNALSSRLYRREKNPEDR